jgi:hypothetical protein
MTRINQLTFGAPEIGRPVFTGLTWLRFDTYTYTRNGAKQRLTRFCADADDDSPVYNGKLHLKCCSCTFGFEHTTKLHNKRIAKAIAQAKEARKQKRGVNGVAITQTR